MDVSTPHNPDSPHDVTESTGLEGLSETSDKNLSNGEDESTAPPESPEQSESEAGDEPHPKRRKVRIRLTRVPLTEVTDSVGARCDSIAREDRAERYSGLDAGGASVNQDDAVEEDGGGGESDDPMDIDSEDEGHAINDAKMKRVHELEGEFSMAREPFTTFDADTELRVDPEGQFILAPNPPMVSTIGNYNTRIWREEIVLSGNDKDVDELMKARTVDRQTVLINVFTRACIIPQ
ncbi:hypothetical protein QQZ08_009967 [Neonectria magnoliae]|uniref:Uncharacterized protein n=1 Tax=Neonectria magnoliae TaxID=2732573 RepID=A0ABR1HKT7_9HYPO